MRAVLPADLDIAARALAAAPAGQRGGLIDAILSRAHVADRWRRHSGRRHPAWGSGTLADAAAAAGLAPPPVRLDAAACALLAEVLAGLARWRADPARRSPASRQLARRGDPR